MGHGRVLAIVGSADGRAGAYALTVAAGLYTQPLTIVVAGVQLAYASWERRDWTTIAAAASVAAALLLFVPWMVFASPYWHAELVQEVEAHFGWAEIRLVAKELTGLGYFGSVTLLGLAAYGLTDVERSQRRFWALYLAVPIAGALAIDYVAGYFVAIRQMIFVLAPLAITATLGLRRLSRGHPAVGAAFAAAIVVGSVYENARWFERPRDDWSAAAEALAGASPPTVCALFVDEDYVKVYRFFDPDVDELLCGKDLSRTEEVILARSPYDSPRPPHDLLLHLQLAGWTIEETRRFGGPELLRLVRPFADHSPFDGPQRLFSMDAGLAAGDPNRGERGGIR